MDYWVSPTGQYALWYMSSGSHYYWLIGQISDVGTFSCWMYTVSSVLEKKCPNNDGHTWNWNYWNSNNWSPTNDLSIQCLDPNTSGSRKKQILNETIYKYIYVHNQEREFWKW